MLGFSLKCARFPYSKTGKHWGSAMNVSGNILPCFADVLLKLVRVKMFAAGTRKG